MTMTPSNNNQPQPQQPPPQKQPPHAKKRKAPPSDAVLAGQEFYQQQLRKSLRAPGAAAEAKPRRRRTTITTPVRPAAQPPKRRTARSVLPTPPPPPNVASSTAFRKSSSGVSLSRNSNNKNNNRKSLVTVKHKDEEKDPDHDDVSVQSHSTHEDDAGDEETVERPSTSSIGMNGRAAKRARHHSPPQQPSEHNTIVTATTAASSTTATNITSSSASPLPPKQRSPVRQGQEYYQAQILKKTSPPVVRVAEAASSAVARPRPSLPPPPPSNKSNNSHAVDNDPRLRRHYLAVAAPPNLELLPQERQEIAATDDMDHEETSFFDAIPEPSPTNTTTAPRAYWNKQKRWTIIVVAPVIVAMALTVTASSSSSSHQQLWMWLCQRVVPKTSSRLSCPQFWSSSSSTHSGPPCFADFPFPDANATPAKENLPPPHCHDHTPRTACPPHGICRAGVLHQCRNPQHWQANGTACGLTPTARDTVHATRDLLAKYSVHVLCGSRPSQHPLFHQFDNENINDNDKDQHSSSGVPLFRYRPLAETYLQTPYDPELLEFANEEKLTFVLRTATTPDPQDGNDKLLLLVGLHPQYPLEIPLQCTLRNYVGMVTQLVGAVLLGVLGILGSYLWDSLVTAPLQTVVLLGGGSLLLWWILGIRRRNRAKRQRDWDIVHLRHAALVQLQQQQGGTAAPHLRDALAWAWYPTNRAQRQYVQHQLWPCVVQDLCSDSRVECRYESNDGSDNGMVLQWRALSLPPNAAAAAPRVHFGSEKGRSS